MSTIEIETYRKKHIDITVLLVHIGYMAFVLSSLLNGTEIPLLDFGSICFIISSSISFFKTPELAKLLMVLYPTVILISELTWMDLENKIVTGTACIGLLALSMWAFPSRTRKRIVQRAGGCSEVSGRSDIPLEASHIRHGEGGSKNGILMTVIEHLAFHERAERDHASEKIGLNPVQNGWAIGMLQKRVGNLDIPPDEVQARYNQANNNFDEIERGSGLLQGLKDLISKKHLF